jgi:KaiC domain protein
MSISKAIERLSTGIRKFDELIEGGIPRGFFVSVVGEPGTGKTIFCIHYANQGIIDGDRVIYVTTEESRESIINQASQFNFDFEKAIQDKKMIIIDALMKEKLDEWSLFELTVEELVKKVIEAKKELGYGRTRLIVDSMSAFWLDKPAMARRMSYFVKRVLHKWDVTALLVSQYAVTSDLSYGFGLEHVADGIIRFKKVIMRGELRRFVLIEKMRQTNHDLRAHEIRILPGQGLVLVSPTEMRSQDLRMPPKVIKKMEEAKEKSRAQITDEPEWSSE